jgi:hypothetical protein
MAISRSESQTRPRARIVVGAVAVLAAVVTTGIVSSAIAERARVLGNSPRMPNPNCPGEFCQVNGHVTGFQRAVDGKKNLFKVPKKGKIVAWGLDLSKPSKEQREVFGELAAVDRFGGKPTAGLAILGKRANQKYRLARKSPVLPVQSYLGESPTFTLNDPLKVTKGQIVALTTVTWLPNFAADNEQRPISRRNIWVGSRTQKKWPDDSPGNGERNCDFPPSVPPQDQPEYYFANSSPHKKVGSERKYGCVYRNARLMYYAYFVPNN